MKPFVNIFIGIILLLTTRIASAQTNLFNLPKITDINVYFQYSPINRIDNRELYGYGLEIAMDLDSLTNKVRGGLALGYGQMNNVKMNLPDYGQSTVLREIPSVSIYATFNPSSCVSIFGGLHSGIIQYSGRLYDSDLKMFSFTATAFDLGLGLGCVTGTEKIGFFVEFSYMHRYFPYIEYTLPSGTNSVPAEIPRDFNASGLYITAGIQFEIQKR